MSDQNLIPISDEQAKLGQELTSVGKAFGRYLANTLGDLPKDFIGLLFGDKIKALRVEQLARLCTKTQKHLYDQGISEPVPPNLKLTLPILSAASFESREELQDLWARLLAAAMNPNRSNQVRLSFSGALEKLDPLDAKVMLHFHKIGGSVNNDKKQLMAEALDICVDELLVCQRNLEHVGFVANYNGKTAGLTPFGREFLRAILY